MSAPLCFITSCGDRALPDDFDILSPTSLRMKPQVTTPRYGAPPPTPAPISTDNWNQRRLEPAAMLLVALEVDVGGPGQLRPRPQHGDLRAARVEPDVENVALLAVLALDALRARRAVEVGRRAVEPGVGAFALEELLHPGEELRRGDGFAAAFAIENGDRHAPEALAGDAPVGAVLAIGRAHV